MTSLLYQAAQRIEKTAGLRAGLYAYRGLLERAVDTERRQVTLSALRCAAVLGDLGAFHALLTQWLLRDGPTDPGLVALAYYLLRRDRRERALELCTAEHSRAPSAATAYFLAAHTEDSAQREARLAEVQIHGGDAGLVARASLRRAELLHARGAVDQAIALARGLTTDGLPPADRARLARLLLTAESRFLRATGYGILADVVHLPALEAQVLGVAARALTLGLPRLSPLEVDRAHALFARLNQPARRAAWRDWLDELLTLAHMPTTDRAFAARASVERELVLAARDAVGGILPLKLRHPEVAALTLIARSHHDDLDLLCVAAVSRLVRRGELVQTAHLVCDALVRAASRPSSAVQSAAVALLRSMLDQGLASTDNHRLASAVHDLSLQLRLLERDLGPRDPAALRALVRSAHARAQRAHAAGHARRAFALLDHARHHANL